MNLTIAVGEPRVIPIVERRMVPLAFEVGDLAFNNLDKVVKKDGQALPLGELQYALLYRLAWHAYKDGKHPVEKRALVQEMYGATCPKSNSFDVRLWEVRTALRRAGSSLLVQNFYGRGYKLVAAK